MIAITYQTGQRQAYAGVSEGTDDRKRDVSAYRTEAAQEVETSMIEKGQRPGEKKRGPKPGDQG